MENAKMRVDNLTAMVSSIDVFPTFSKNVAKLLSTSKNYELTVENLENISSGKKVFGANKEKKFYKENKKAVDTINKYSNVGLFLLENYSKNGAIANTSLIENYQYIIKHKFHQKEMIDLLEKIAQEGFTKIVLDEQADFTNQGYELYTNYESNTHFYYLDNMVAIPSYDDSVIKYKSQKSDYRIEILPDTFFTHEQCYGEIIEVKSLYFSPDRLPKVINKNTTFDKILALKNEKEKEYKVIKEAVNLNVGVEDLLMKYQNMESIVANLSDTDKRGEVVSALKEVNNGLKKLQMVSRAYNVDLLYQTPEISREQLDEEAKIYIKKRGK